VIVQITAEEPIEEIDELELMQRAPAPSQQQQAASSSDGASRTFCFNPRAVEFNPQGANIHLYDEFTQPKPRAGLV
jgi:hypothetical protein